MHRRYEVAALEGATPVELVIALYDGLIRFLGDAAQAASRGDVEGRRTASRRALDIIIHLQAVLRIDIGGRPALALAEFYATIFASVLRASAGASAGEFEMAIGCVRPVREAWHQVSREQARQNTDVIPAARPAGGLERSAINDSGGWMA